jgi:hypothetical protein
MTEVVQDNTVVASDNTELETFDGVIEQQWGLKLPSPVSYIAEYAKILRADAIPAKEQPTSEDILSFVNSKRKANARQKAMQDALDVAADAFERDNGKNVTNPYRKPTLESSDTLRVKSMVDSMVAQKKADGTPLYTREAAEKMARQILGLA